MAKPEIVAIVLAAGRSTRMGEVNKLLKTWNGKPLIEHVLKAAKAARGLAGLIAVTGHQADQVAAILGGNVPTVHNPDYAGGMASSLRTGIAEADRMGADGALILLGDMPLVTADHIEAILQTHAAAEPNAIIQATCEGKPGNPVLLPKSLFAELLQVRGDKGARSIIGQHQDDVTYVELGIAAAQDFDTPESFHNDQA